MTQCPPAVLRAYRRDLAENLIVTSDLPPQLLALCRAADSMECNLRDQRPFYVADGSCQPMKSPGTKCGSHSECAFPGLCLGGHCCAPGVGSGCARCSNSTGVIECRVGNCVECVGDAGDGTLGYSLVKGVCQVKELVHVHQAVQGVMRCVATELDAARRFRAACHSYVATLPVLFSSLQ